MKIVPSAQRKKSRPTGLSASRNLIARLLAGFGVPASRRTNEIARILAETCGSARVNTAHANSVESSGLAKLGTTGDRCTQLARPTAAESSPGLTPGFPES